MGTTRMLLRLLAAVAGAPRYLWRDGRPTLEGTLKVPGLKGRVEVLRDRWGVPHIYAQRDEDLFFAQGFVQAQDRWVQMELGRRLGSGRLAEVAGEKLLEADRFARTVGFRRQAVADWAHLGGEVRSLLEAFAAGVNAYLGQEALPPEAALLDPHPEPWTPVDSLILLRLMAWSLSLNWEAELRHARAAAQVPPERIPLLNPPIPEGLYPDTVAGVRDFPALFDRALKALEGLPAALRPPHGQGSNAWAVSPARSATGHALLAGDPHLGLTLPAVWHLIHLESPTVRAAGATLPGLPLIGIGHNGRVAWSFTASMVDVQDLYVEELRREDGRVLRRREEAWIPVRRIEERIRIRGGRTEVLEILETDHGGVPTPILSPVLEGEERALALAWAGAAPSRCVEGFLDLIQARNAAQVFAAAEKLDLLPLNLVFATADGEIGYQLVGRHPIRDPDHQGHLPVDGTDPRWDWKGWIPFRELPRMWNPPEGRVVSANHRIVGPDYPYNLGNEWMGGFRARRIQTLLEGTPQHTLETFRQIQLDVHAEDAEDVLPYLLETPPESEAVRRAQELLRNWDREMAPDSAGAILYHTWRERLQRLVIERLVGPELAPLFLSWGSRPEFALFTTHAWKSFFVLLDGLRGQLAPHLSQEEARQLGLRALKDAWDEVAARQGPDPQRWRWDRRNRLVLVHPLGDLPLVGRRLNLGPYPLPGGPGAVLQSHLLFLNGRPLSVGPSLRLLVELGERPLARAVVPPGQWAHPETRHYNDNLALWLRGELHPLLWTRSEVEEALESRLELRGEGA